MKKSTEQNTRDFSLIEFDHVTLVVAKVADSRKFYVDQLGFEEVPRPAFSFAGAWLKLGQTMIHLTEYHELSGESGWGDRAAKRTSRGHHIAYRTSDFEKVIKAIEYYGVKIAAGPKIRVDGAKQVFIYDPDQHVIEICS